MSQPSPTWYERQAAARGLVQTETRTVRVPSDAEVRSYMHDETDRDTLFVEASYERMRIQLWNGR